MSDLWRVKFILIMFKVGSLGSKFRLILSKAIFRRVYTVLRVKVKKLCLIFQHQYHLVLSRYMAEGHGRLACVCLTFPKQSSVHRLEAVFSDFENLKF